MWAEGCFHCLLWDGNGRSFYSHACTVNVTATRHVSAVYTNNWIIRFTFLFSFRPLNIFTFWQQIINPYTLFDTRENFYLHCFFKLPFSFCLCVACLQSVIQSTPLLYPTTLRFQLQYINRVRILKMPVGGL